MKFNCKVCLSENIEKVNHEKYVEVRCADCNSHSFFTSHRYQYGEDEKYTDQKYLSSYELRWAHEKVLHYFKSNLVNSVNSECKVLEIGCFSGQFVHEVRTLGIDAFGFDINSSAIQFGNNTFFDGKQYLYDNLASVYNTVDAIILIDVLEHIDDPNEFLNQIPDRIKYVFISSPDPKRILFDKTDFPPHHVTRVHPLSINSILSVKGFTLDVLIYQSSLLLFIRNLIGRVKYGWNKKFYTGSKVYKVNSLLFDNLYKKIDNFTSYLLSKIGFKYCSYLIVLKK
jgi:hypothetical protein